MFGAVKARKSKERARWAVKKAQKSNKATKPALSSPRQAKAASRPLSTDHDWPGEVGLAVVPVQVHK
jgi:hypothetical protein